LQGQGVSHRENAGAAGAEKFGPTSQPARINGNSARRKFRNEIADKAAHIVLPASLTLGVTHSVPLDDWKRYTVGILRRLEELE
jgi:hypothetical protein